MNSNILESLKTKYHSVIQKIIDENEEDLKRAIKQDETAE